MLVASGITDHPQGLATLISERSLNFSFIRTSLSDLPNLRGREALRRIILQFFHVKYTSQAKENNFCPFFASYIRGSFKILRNKPYEVRSKREQMA